MKTFLYFLLLLFPVFAAAQDLNIQTIENHLRNNNYSLAIGYADKMLGLDSSRTDVKILRAQALAALFRTKESAGILNELYLKDSSNIIILRELFGIHKNSGNTSEAIRFCRMLIQQDPRNEYYRLQLASLSMLSKNYREAADVLLGLYKTDSSSFYINKQLGSCYDELSVYDSAFMFYHRALDISRDPYVTNRLANLLIRNQKYPPAVATTMDYLSYDSTFVPVRKQLAYALYLLGNYEFSIDEFTKCIRLGDSSQFTLKYMALGYYRLARYDSALPLLRQLVRADSADPYHSFYYGVSYSRLPVEKPDSGILWLKHAEQLIMPSPKFLSMIYEELGNACGNLHKTDSAIGYYKLSLKYNPENHLATFRIAYLYDRELNKPSEALPYYRDFIKNSDSGGMAGFIPEPNITGSTVNSLQMTMSYQDFAKERVAAITRRKKETGK